MSTLALTAPRAIGRKAAIATMVATAATATTMCMSTSGQQAVEHAPSMRIQVIVLTNHERAAHGCAAVHARRKLTLAAQRHANDMSAHRYFSHTSADGTSWITRIRRTGYKQPGGENIAYGYSSPASLVSAWMHSPEHRRNILDCNFRTIGIGYAPNGAYAVEDFGY